MSANTVTSSSSKLDTLGSFVHGSVMRLQSQYALGAARGTPWATRTLAALRRMHPDDPGRDPDVFAFLFEEMPEELIGHSDQPSRPEFAAATALHLYAIHQQGRGDAMHRPGQRWGGAVNLLARRRGSNDKLDEGVVRRFQRLCLASSRQIRLVELRGLARMLRAEQIPVDYGVLARDIHRLDSLASRSGVQLQWARDFHARTKSLPDEPAIEPATPAEPSTQPE